MDVIRTIPAGGKGSKRFLKEWGHQLIAVRYHRDTVQQRICTTIEIIVDERPNSLPGTQIHGYLAERNHSPVALKILFEEKPLRDKL